MKKVNQPKRLTYRQLSGVKTYNLHVPAKTSAFVVKWPSDPAAQRPSGPAAQRPSSPAAQQPSGLATNRHTTPQKPIQIPPVQSRRATEKALGSKISVFHSAIIIINNLTRIICSLILGTRYPFNLNVNLIVFGGLKSVERQDMHANAPSYFQNEQSKELLGYQ